MNRFSYCYWNVTIDSRVSYTIIFFQCIFFSRFVAQTIFTTWNINSTATRSWALDMTVWMAGTSLSSNPGNNSAGNVDRLAPILYSTLNEIEKKENKNQRFWEQDWTKFPQNNSWEAGKVNLFPLEHDSRPSHFASRQAHFELCLQILTFVKY